VITESGFPVDSGTRSSVGAREHGVPCDSGKLKLRVAQGTQSSGYLWEHGVPGDSGNTEFRVTTGNRISGSLRNTDFRVTP